MSILLTSLSAIDVYEGAEGDTLRHDSERPATGAIAWTWWPLASLPAVPMP